MNKDNINNLIGYSTIFLIWIVALLFNYVDYQNTNNTNIKYCTSGNNSNIMLCINKHNDTDRELLFRRILEK